MPDRIQLSRAKGWRMPEGAVKVDRTTKWGNPFWIGVKVCSGQGFDYTEDKITTAAKAVEAFRDMLQLDRRNFPSDAEIRAQLRGKTLACWCKPGTPCHADVLLEIANA
jgi:hypothetical protein